MYNTAKVDGHTTLYICIQRAKQKNSQFTASLTRGRTREIMSAWETACCLLWMCTPTFLGPHQSTPLHPCSPTPGPVWNAPAQMVRVQGRESTGYLGCWAAHSMPPLRSLSSCVPTLAPKHISDLACLVSLPDSSDFYPYSPCKVIILDSNSSVVLIFYCCITGDHKFISQFPGIRGLVKWDSLFRVSLGWHQGTGWGCNLI